MPDGGRGWITRRPGRGWLRQVLRNAAARQWARLANRVQTSRKMPSPELCDEARALHSNLGRFLQRADALAEGRGARALPPLPAGTDWDWRLLSLRGEIDPASVIMPASGQRFGDELTLWHDCPRGAMILRQMQNRDRPAQPPFALRLEIMGFEGSYLSLSLDVPKPMLSDLGRHHVVQLDTVIQAERAATIYARLNLVQGPNTETMLRQLGEPIEGRDTERQVWFDLAYADLTEQPIDKAWMDLIFEAPGMNAVTVNDMILSRHPRAQV